ncbi:RWD-domain-containing protein [Patellaria atrata CBS 101060]|uniref:RWD-domain-containing protein n=1 Tax=Patellaria atrata CBS 101060 TaxID=1346257 RepID=A0A9P4VW66_9PEZI|nr:RWD-domain-containing protein [Patellaria atrata CBS 101060]
MGAEEQAEEIEVLSAIYPDELQVISPTDIRITIPLELSSSSEDAPEAPILILNIHYTPLYPTTAPDIDITSPPNAPKHTFLSLLTDKPLLLSTLSTTASSNLGDAMVFTLASTLKETAETLILTRSQELQQIQDLEAAREEEEENRKFHGTQVTRASFVEWWRGFREEVEEEKRRVEAEREVLEKKGRKEERKLTGRELWERGLARAGAEEEEGDVGVDALEGVERLKVEA